MATNYLRLFARLFPGQVLSAKEMAERRVADKYLKMASAYLSKGNYAMTVKEVSNASSGVKYPHSLIIAFYCSRSFLIFPGSLLVS